jgi:hypothetical protein
MVRTQSFALTLLFATIACGGGTATPTAPSAPPPPSPTIFSLSGTVREWPTRKNIAGATVSVVDGPNAGSATVTDASGNYRLAGLEHGEFTIVVSAPDHIPQTITGSLTSNRQIDFELRHRGAAYEVTGMVIDEDGRPLADAAVAFDFVSPDNPSRYAQPQVGTDAAGNYRISFAAAPAGHAGSVAFARANKDGYEADNRWFRGETYGSHILNFHLYRSRRLTAGETTTVAIAPDDSICFNNVRDFPGLGPDYICRTVRIVAPIDGVMTVEALSVANGAHPSLAVETVNPAPYLWRFENPTSIPVAAGTEVMANIEMPASSSTRESFTLKTAMASQ